MICNPQLARVSRGRSRPAASPRQARQVSNRTPAAPDAPARRPPLRCGRWSAADPRYRRASRRRPSRSTTSVTRSRVVPGMSVTIARDVADQRVEHARFPDVRLPDDRNLQSLANEAPAPRVRRAAVRSARSARRPRPPGRQARRSDSPLQENRPTLRVARSDRTAPRRSHRCVRVSVPCS